MVIEFLGGATGHISFDFAVTSESDSSYPEAYIQLYGKDWYYQPEEKYVTGSPAEGSFEIDLSSTAYSAHVWFYPGFGNGFIVDNFQATVGTTHAPIGQGEMSDFDADGDVDGLDLTQVAADPTCMTLNSFVLYFAKVGTVCPCTCHLTSEAGSVSLGSSFHIDATVTNEWITGEPLYFSRYITLPNLSRYPTNPESYLNQDPEPITLGTGKSISGVFPHALPDDWPTGTYTNHGVRFVSGKTTLAECEYEFQVLNGQ
jgi:hypothetical protein